MDADAYVRRKKERTEGECGTHGGHAGEGRRAELQRGADGDDLRVGDREPDVSCGCDGELLWTRPLRWVKEKKKRTLDAEVTALDEGAGKSKNLIGKEGNVERLRDRREALEEVEDGLMTRFDGHDGGSGGEDAGLLDEVRSTEVRANADVLDELREGHHGRDVGEHARKVELALYRRLTESDDDVLDGGHMHELVPLDDRDLLDDDV